MKFNKKVTMSRRKNRKAHFTAPVEERRIRMSCQLSPSLRKQYGFRSFPVRINDKVTVMTGKNKGKSGTVVCVRRKLYKVYIDSIEVTKVNGGKVNVGFDASNLMITEFCLDNDRKNVLNKRKENVEEAKKLKVK